MHQSFITIFIFLLLSAASTLPAPAAACTFCSQPAHPRPIHHHPNPKTPALNPPPGDGGGQPAFTPRPPPPPAKCSLDILKLELCLDVLGGLVNLGFAPVQSYCCPVIQGLLELEAAACLCAAINLKLLNLNIYIPLALEVLITCGKDPPPGYFCPLIRG
ncbi:36.4 kDa proline-rich protein [Platanthera zijinensis]|uniref:36.4 kDa proline-rich protein n=1 Tax=Platanthera zijinensis TaxID=2320716 RepID=A0AAP0G7C4_9ASPA